MQCYNRISKLCLTDSRGILFNQTEAGFHVGALDVGQHKLISLAAGNPPPN